MRKTCRRFCSRVTLLVMLSAFSPLVLAFQARQFLQRPNHPVSHYFNPFIPSLKRESSLLMSPTDIIIPSNKVDILAIVTGALLLIGYHLRLYKKERDGKKTWRGAQADIREKWSQFVRANEQWLYAIQTLRNAITAQTFLATTVLSLLTVIGGRLWDIIRKTNQINNEKNYLVAQFVMLTFCMLTSAFHFLQAARFMTHAGFMFPVDPKSTKVDNIMRKTENAQWLGLRFLYSSVVILTWVVGGAKPFAISSLLLTIFFQKIDGAPEGIDNDNEKEGDLNISPATAMNS